MKRLFIVIGFWVSMGGCETAGNSSIPRIGENVRLEALELAYLESHVEAPKRGRAVLLNVWATWCGPCIHEHPALERVATEFSGTIDVIMVSTEEAEVVENYLRQQPNSEIIYAIGLPDEVLGLAGSSALPTSLLIDRHGKLRYRLVGAQEYSTFENRLLRLLSAQPVGTSAE